MQLLLTSTVRNRFIFTKALEYRLPQAALFCILHEFYRSYQWRINPYGIFISLRDRCQKAGVGFLTVLHQIGKRCPHGHMSFVYHLMVLVILCQNKRYNAFLLDNIATDDKIIIHKILAFDPVLRALSTT